MQLIDTHRRRTNAGRRGSNLIRFRPRTKATITVSAALTLIRSTHGGGESKGNRSTSRACIGPSIGRNRVRRKAVSTEFAEPERGGTFDEPASAASVQGASGFASDGFNDAREVVEIDLD